MKNFYYCGGALGVVSNIEAMETILRTRRLCPQKNLGRKHKRKTSLDKQKEFYCRKNAFIFYGCAIF